MTRPDVVRRILRAAEKFPERPAIELPTGTLTYDQFVLRAGAVAQQLKRGQRNVATPLTAIIGQRSSELYVGAVAALMRGHGYLPLSSLFPASRMRHILAQTDCGELIVDEVGLRFLGEVLDGLERPLFVVTPNDEATLELRRAWPKHRFETQTTDTPTELLAELSPSQDLMYVLFTSGSTGAPKGVMVTRGNVASFLDVVQERYAITENDRFSQTFEMTFDLSAFDTFGAWTNGACLCACSLPELLATGDYLSRSRVSVLCAVPSLAVGMDRNGMLHPGAFPDLRLSVFCGEPLPASLVQKWSQAAPRSRIENAYGPTELTIFCTSYQWPAGGAGRVENGIVSIGRPFSTLSALVVDDALKPVSVGEPGELLVTGPQLSLGYWKDAERTNKVFVVPPGKSETFYRTGDRVRQIDSQGALVFLGRIDDQVKVGGYRVELGEVDAVVREVSGAGSVATIGWPQSEGGFDGLVTFVAGTSMNGAELRGLVSARLPLYMVPSAIHVLKDLPTNVNGKIDRKALQKLLTQRADEPAPTSRVPGTPTERKLVTAVEEILSRPPGSVSLTDDFFELGGDSLGALTLETRLAGELGIAIPIFTVAKYRRLEDLSRHLVDRAALVPAGQGSVSVTIYDSGDSAPPLYLLPPGWGAGLAYMPLRSFFAGKRATVRALMHPWFIGDDVADMQEEHMVYAQEIASSSKGPVMLGGWSRGAEEVFATALFLRAKNVEVSKVFLFDLPPPPNWKTWLSVVGEKAIRLALGPLAKMATHNTLARSILKVLVRNQLLRVLVCAPRLDHPPTTRELRRTLTAAGLLGPERVASVSDQDLCSVFLDALRAGDVNFFDVVGGVFMRHLSPKDRLLAFSVGVRKQRAFSSNLRVDAEVHSFSPPNTPFPRRHQRRYRRAIQTHAYDFQARDGLPPHLSVMHPDNISLYFDDFWQLLAA